MGLSVFLMPLLLVVQPIPAPKPKDAVPVTFPAITAAAVADASAYPKPAHVRYFSVAHMTPAERRAFFGVLATHVNYLSRGPDRATPRKVNEWLWAVDTTDYVWNPKVWEDLKRVNHYFCIKVQASATAAKVVRKNVTEKVKKQRQVYKTDQYNRGYYATEDYYEDVTREVVETVAEAVAAKEDFIPAPWLPTADMDKLVKLTGSVTPIVRGDLFLFETAAQVQRDGHGYYDWLELKTIEDAEKLATLDRKLAEKTFRELADIMKRSGVSPNNRQIFWYRTVGGSWWESRDVNTSVGKQNAVVNLLGDFEHDAEEIVFTLPNRMTGFFLNDRKNKKRVDSAPDSIASDRKTTNNDARVHVCYACVSCHQDGGLKPFDGYARRKFNPDKGNSLAVLDPEQSKRLKSVYLGPMKKEYDNDAKDYGEYVTELSGLAPEKFAAAYQKAWSEYIDGPVTIERAAAECGVTADVLSSALKAYAKRTAAANKVVNQALSDLIEPEPDPMRREHWEEVFPIAMLVLGGLDP